MPDVKTSDLPEDAAVDGTEQLVAVDGVSTKIVLGSLFAAYVVDTLAGAAAVDPVLAGDDFLLFRSGTEKLADVGKLASYIVATGWSEASAADPTVSGDMILADRSGTVYKIDVDTLVTYALGSVQADVLDISGLAAATLTDADQYLVVQTSTAKKTTYTNLAARFHAGIGPYTTALDAVVTVGATDKLYTLQSTTAKYVTPVELATYFAGAIDVEDFGWDMTEVDPTVAGDMVLTNRSGAIYKTDVDTLSTYIMDGAQAGILNISGLDTATIADGDFVLIVQTTTAKKATYSAVSTKVLGDMVAHVTGLAAVTTTADTDKFYVLQGGVAKYVTPVELNAYFTDIAGDVYGPAGGSTENKVPQWDATNKYLKDGLALLTEVRVDGSAVDTAVVTEQAVYEALGVIATLDIDGATDIGEALADADLIIVDNGAGGTNRKSAISRVWTYITTKVQALSAKTTPIDADILTIQDSAAANALKELTVAHLWDNRYLADAKAIKLDDFTALDDNTDLDASASAHGLMPKNDKVKIDAIGTAADITMNTDTDVSGNSWVLDEDNMVTNSATKVSTQQAVKAYVDANAPENAVMVQFDDDADRAATFPVYEGQLAHQIDTNRVYVGDAATHDISTAAYNSKHIDVYSAGRDPYGVVFSSDGTKMYVLSNTYDTVYQYSLSSAWDVTTATYDSVSCSVTAEENVPFGLAFNSGGTAMYVVGTTNDTVYQYTLSGAWDLSTASYASKSVSVTAEETLPYGIAFSGDGSKMYIVGKTNKTVYQYTLSTPWDVSTGTYATKSHSVNAEDTAPVEVDFSSDGTKMYVLGQTNDTVFQYTLSSAWDVSTASYASKSVSVNSEDATPGGMAVYAGIRLYIAGTTQDDIFQYAMGFEWDELGTFEDVYEEAWVPASQMTPSTTTGAAADTKEYVTNDLTHETLLFDGAAQDESAEFNLVMPPTWNRGTIKFKAYWTNGHADSNPDEYIKLSLAAGAFSNDDALDAALGTAVGVTDQLIVDDDLHITAASAAITVGGTPALADLIHFKLTRDFDYAGAGAAMDVDLRLIGIQIQFQKTNEVSAW